MTFEETLRALCAKHDLTTISIGINVKHGPLAYVHWLDSELRCASGRGPTAAEAIAAAITSANEARNSAPVIELPAFEVAA